MTEQMDDPAWVVAELERRGMRVWKQGDVLEPVFMLHAARIAGHGDGELITADVVNRGALIEALKTEQSTSGRWKTDGSLHHGVLNAEGRMVAVTFSAEDAALIVRCMNDIANIKHSSEITHADYLKTLKSVVDSFRSTPGPFTGPEVADLLEEWIS